MFKYIFGFLVFLCSLYASPIDSADFITEDYPPYSYEEGGELKGVNIEILEAIFNEIDSKKSIKDVSLQTWAIGYEKALNEPNSVLFGMSRTSARENLFKWVGPLAPSSVVLFAKKSSKLDIKSAKDFKDLRIVVIKDDVGEQLVREAGALNKNIIVAPSNTAAAQMLHRGLADMWAYGDLVGFWLIDDLGYDRDEYEIVYELFKSYHYIAIQKDSSEEIVDILQNGLDRAKKSGVVQKILDRGLN